MAEHLLEVETITHTGDKRNFYIPYDKLVVAVGSVSSTHGVPGLEHSYQLKTIADVQAIRRRIMGVWWCISIVCLSHSESDNFETASLPTTSPEERKRLLSFVVCGGGPTGVETAAVELYFLCHDVADPVLQEIYDFCQEDIMKYV